MDALLAECHLALHGDGAGETSEVSWLSIPE